MKHLVFGTGLIGGFIGGGLLNADIDVTFLGRDKQRVAMKGGLTISDLIGNTVALGTPIFWDETDDTVFDVVWLTIKGTAVKDSVKQLINLMSPNTIIICCQNGFGSDAIVKQNLPTHTVLSAVVGFNVAERAGNHLHRSTDGRFVIEAHANIDHCVTQLNCDILPAHTSQNIDADRWAKLQLNLANPVNALADIPIKAMTEDSDFRTVIAALMKELLSVTKAMQLDLPKLTAVPAWLLPTVLNLPNFIYLKLAQQTLAIDPTARASTWWDLNRGNQSEIKYLNQSVVEQGERLGLDCVFNRRIVDLIHQVEKNERTIGLTGLELQELIGIT